MLGRSLFEWKVILFYVPNSPFTEAAQKRLLVDFLCFIINIIIYIKFELDLKS